MTRWLTRRVGVTLFALLSACGGGTSGGPEEPVGNESQALPTCPECPELPIPELTGSDDEEVVSVVAGSCSLGWLPPDLIDDVSDAEAAELVDQVRGWLEEGFIQIAPRRGIVFAKSPDDSGADEPPSWSGAFGGTVCGHHAQWLRSWLRDEVRFHSYEDWGGGVTCNENICCFPALGEYDSGGTLIFDRDVDGYWFLRAVAIVANNGTLADDYIEELEAQVAAALAAAGGECLGEPDSLW